MEPVSNFSTKKIIAEVSLVAIFVLVFLFGRCYVSGRETLWTDELWSLCMATGHSMCQTPDQTRPELGDYVEALKPMPVSYYGQYTNFNPKTKLAETIIRACSLGDYNSPFYYLLLGYWLKLAGTSDFSLRLPSIVFSFLSMPFIWLIAERLGSRKAAFISCFLYVFAPMAIFYSTEARVYSLVIFFSSILVWLTLLLPTSKGGKILGLAIGWTILAGMAQLISPTCISTVLACAIWLALQRKVFPIKIFLSMLLGVALISSVWYLHLPALLSVKNSGTEYYAGSRPFLFAAVLAATHLLALFSSFGNNTYSSIELFSMFLFLTLLPTVPRILSLVRNQRISNLFANLFLVAIFSAGLLDVCLAFWIVPGLPETSKNNIFGALSLGALVLVLATAISLYVKKRCKSIIVPFDPGVQLLYLNLLFAIVLPVVFDIVRNLHMSGNHRYVLGALPAAFVLFALALSSFRTKEIILVLLAALCTWMPMYAVFAKSESRTYEDYRALVHCLAEARDTDAIVVNYFYPSDVVGVARYMPVEKWIIGWYSPRHLADLRNDLLPLIRGKTGVYLVWLGPGPLPIMEPIEKWLEENARQEKVWLFSKRFIDYCKYFVPKQGAVF